MAASEERWQLWKTDSGIDDPLKFFWWVLKNSLRFLRALALVGWNRTSVTAEATAGRLRRESKARRQKHTSEIRNQKSEIRNQPSKLEVRTTLILTVCFGRRTPHFSALSARNLRYQVKHERNDRVDGDQLHSFVPV